MSQFSCKRDCQTVYPEFASRISHSAWLPVLTYHRTCVDNAASALLLHQFYRWLNCVKYCVYIQIDYFLKMLWIAIYRHHTVRYTRIIYKNINLSVFPVNCLDFVCHFFCVCQTRAGTGYFPFRIFFL